MTQEYLSMFIEETREHLQAWSDGMIHMEQSGDLSSVPTVFRAAHTIKGMAMTMGFSRMGEITHSAENLLDEIRNGRLPVKRGVVDALFRALDILSGLLDDIEKSGEESGMDIGPLLTLLQNAGRNTAAAASASPAAGQTGSSYPARIAPAPRNAATAQTAVAVAPAPPEEAPARDPIQTVAEMAMEQGYRVYEIEIGFAPGCLMPLARFAQWLSRVDPDRILLTQPEAAVLEAGDYAGDITVVYASTEDPEAVGEVLSEISEIVVRSLAEWRVEPEGQAYRSADGLLPKEGAVTDDPHVRTVIDNALKQGLRVYEAGVLLSPGCQMKSARMFLVFDAIGGQNHLLFTQPHVQEIEQGNMDRQVLFILWSREDLNTIQRALLGVSEIELMDLREWRQQGSELERGDNVAARPQEKPTQKTGAPARRTSTIRVDTEKLDELMNLVSELAIDKTRLERVRTEIAHAGLSETVDHMSRLSGQLQELIMSIRMVPVETVFSRFPRMVRDTAHQLGKEIEFVVSGQETELDRTVVEEIGDPIMHMLRNSLDHGIEPAAERKARGKPEKGRIELRAYAAGNHVFIEVEDDGQGIPREKVLRRARERGIVNATDHLTDSQIDQLLFAPGFSTADQISDLSGRGVGLDVVKTKIETLSGKIDIVSEEGRGTKFVIRLPMTLAIMDGLMVRIGDHPYLIPIGSITETAVLQGTQTVHGKEVVVWRDRVVPILRAREIFGEPPRTGPEYAVFVNRGDRVVGIAVDDLIGQFEVVLKTLDPRLKKIPYFAGATILGDGEVSLIIDANSFIE